MGDYKGCGGLTREQFLYHETKTVAKLMADESLSDEEIVNRVVEENLFQFPTERMIKNIVNVCLKRLTTKEIKAEKVLREIPKKETSVVTKSTKKKTMTAEEAEMEKKKVLYHWFEMLVSLKKLHDADEINYDSALAQLTDENILKRVNDMLEENPNILETEKYITLHDMLGRDLYKDKQLIPIRGEEIVTLVEKYGQSSPQM